MLDPVTIDDRGTERVIRCRHAETWPPYWSRFGTAEDMRGRFNVAEYERAKTWESVCGLQQMEPGKCARCPHALKEDGTPLLPDLSLPSSASQRRLRVRP